LRHVAIKRAKEWDTAGIQHLKIGCHAAVGGNYNSEGHSREGSLMITAAAMTAATAMMAAA